MQLQLSKAIAATAVLLSASTVSSVAYSDGEYRACSRTAQILGVACKHDELDDFNEAVAECINVADSAKRSNCFADAWSERRETKAECRSQNVARKKLCREVGQARYDISAQWVPENFVNPEDIGVSVMANPWFNLSAGTTNTFFGDGETIQVDVKDEYKLVGGVKCRTVSDLVTEDGLKVEDTDDWYAQDVQGNVWYCGEIALNYEFFEGDNPEAAEITDIDGSWKGFRDGALPGIVFHADPSSMVGATYRQEVSWGEAEDVAKILTTTADGMLEGDTCESEEVTEDVAEYLEEMCDENCMVTLEYTPIEPGVTAHKYYGYEQGLLAEVEHGACVARLGVIENEEDDEDEEDDEF